MKVRDLQGKNGCWEKMNDLLRSAIASQVDVKDVKKFYEELGNYDSCFIEEDIEAGCVKEFYLMEGIIPDLEKEVIPSETLAVLFEKEEKKEEQK